jgi:hypothetical protein
MLNPQARPPDCRRQTTPHLWAGLELLDISRGRMPARRRYMTGIEAHV